MATTTAVPGNVPRKSADQIRRITMREHPPRTAFMPADVRTWKRKRVRWERAQQPILFERPSREIVKHKRRIRRAQVIG